MFQDNFLGFIMTLVDDLPDFLIDLKGNLSGHIACRVVIPAQEDILLTMVILHRTKITHPIQRNHIPRQFGRLFDIIDRPSGNIIKEDFFSNPTAHVAGNRRHQVVLSIHDLFFLRRHQVITPGCAARNNRHFLNNIGVFQIQTDNRMAGLMVSH